MMTEEFLSFYRFELESRKKYLTPTKVAYIDMDGVLCDYFGAIQLEFSKHGVYPEYTGKWGDIEGPYDDLRKQVSSTESFWLNLEPIKEGFLGIWVLYELGYKPEIATKCSKDCLNGWSGKAKWLDKYFQGLFDYHITTKKERLKGDVLYDDNPEYLLAWLENNPESKGLIPDRRWNQGFTHDRVLRVNLEEAFYSHALTEEIREFLL